MGDSLRFWGGGSFVFLGGGTRGRYRVQDHFKKEDGLIRSGAKHLLCHLLCPTWKPLLGTFNLTLIFENKFIALLAMKEA